VKPGGWVVFKVIKLNNIGQKRKGGASTTLSKIPKQLLTRTASIQIYKIYKSLPTK
jgi:hypothetical protein